MTSMRKLFSGRHALGICAAIAIIPGCGSQSPIETPGAMPQTRLLQSAAQSKVAHVEYAYVTNAGSNNVSGYEIGSKGALVPVPGSPFGTGFIPVGVAIDPTGKFAYVANAGSDNVSAYTLAASSGTLTPVAGSPFNAESAPLGVAIDPAGSSPT